MEDLILEFQEKINIVSLKFQRYLIDKIDINNRLIAVKGARGSGKTTLLLQMAKRKLPLKSTLYVSLDHIYFFENKLYDLAKLFVKFGGTHLLLDPRFEYCFYFFFDARNLQRRIRFEPKSGFLYPERVVFQGIY